jgi:glutathione S-transferase
MTLQLFAHPFSSYCQKALIALYENDTPFTLRTLSPEDPEAGAEWERLWPLKKMPILKDGDEVIVEATTVIEYLQLRYPGPVRLIPDDPEQALRVRMLDRIFDNYVSTPQQKLVFDSLRPEGQHDAAGVADAKTQLETIYAWLDTLLAGRTWATGEAFTLADCGAAPFLFYADWCLEIPQSLTTLRAYRARLLARPSVVRVVDEARPFRSFFPLGAPDRD